MIKEGKKAHDRKYYEAHKESIKARRREYYLANIDYELARAKAYREANRDSIRARARVAYRKHYEAHKESIKAKRIARWPAERDSVANIRRECFGDIPRSLVPLELVAAKLELLRIQRELRKGAPS